MSCIASCCIVGHKSSQLLLHLAGSNKASILRQPLDSGSDDSDFASTSESEDEQMGSEGDADVQSQDGEVDMEHATTSGNTCLLVCCMMQLVCIPLTACCSIEAVLGTPNWHLSNSWHTHPFTAVA